MSVVSAVQKSFEQGVARHRAGQLLDAERAYAEVLKRDPLHEQAQFLSAAIALETGRNERALEMLLALVERSPTNAAYFTNLGEAFRRSGNNERAAAALTRAVALKPDLAQAHFNLGLVTRNLGERETALAALVRAAELKPEDAQIQRGLANLLVDLGAHARAVGHFQCALLASRQHAPLLLDYARCLRELGRTDAALRAATRAAELEPQNALAHHERSMALSEQGRFDEALGAAERAVALEPRSASALMGLASALTDTGRLTEGLAAYRQLVEVEPDNHQAHANLVFLEAFRPDATAESILGEARAWSAKHAAPFAPQLRAREPDMNAQRRLRIGYVSSNFNQHCQALFTLPLLAAHDREAFELYAYASGHRQDAVTRELRGHFAAWHDITGLTPLAAAELIRSHQVDILIDLTMHMSECLLRVFACKPAPVQIAWLAYPGTTGLPAMDYRVTDAHIDLPESLAGYSEASLVLPDTFWCYAPGTGTPEVSALPARNNGHVTFGCLNSFWKLNEPTLELWAGALAAVPDSRLLLLAPEGSARTRVLNVLRAFGVDSSRVTFAARRPRNEYLKLYHDIDICLDALPYNGHTTSLDAFWMGVPVVTLVGNTVVGRAGLCQARNLGLPELVARDNQQFAGAAAQLAGDLDALAALRSGLRERLQSSPLMDAPRFARNLESLYRDAWRRWCEGPDAR